MAGVILPIAALLIAVLLVAALWLWWSDQPEPVTANSADAEISAYTTLDVATSMPTTAAPAAAVASPSSSEMLRVMRGRDGALAVMVNGMTYHSMSELSRHAATHDDFMTTLQALSQFAQSADIAPIQAQAPTSITAATPIPVAEPTPPKPAPARRSTPGRTAEEEAAAVEAERNTMAGQIEAILQTRLARNAEMDGRSIHIHSTPSGGVEIIVDDLLYESVGDITDAAARSVIEAAIRDWEAAHPY